MLISDCDRAQTFVILITGLGSQTLVADSCAGLCMPIMMTLGCRFTRTNIYKIRALFISPIGTLSE